MSYFRLSTLSLVLALSACTAPSSISPQPSAQASASPSPSTSSSPSVQPTAAPSQTPLPLASATSDVGLVKASYKGIVYDEQQRPLSDVLVVGISLNSSVPYQASTRSSDGRYHFTNAPPGIQIAVTASKPGYTSRTRRMVLKEGNYIHDEDPNFNRFDFGTGPDSLNPLAEAALSDKPEVVAGRLILGSDQSWQGLGLRFSEPMDRSSVENGLLIYLPSAPAGSTERLGYDKFRFDLSWNADDTELTLRFKTGSAAVSQDLLGKFQATFTTQIRDKNGLAREQGYFRLAETTENSSALQAFTRGEFPNPSPSALQGGGYVN